MIEGKLFDIVGGIIIDLVKDQIKQHKLLNTSFLKMFNEAIDMALEQLYTNQKEREEKWNISKTIVEFMSALQLKKTWVQA